MADDFSKDNDLDITIGYNDVGEKAAIKGAENVGKAIEKVGKKAKKAGDTDLKTLEDGLIKVGTASDSVANKQKKVGDALSSSVEKLKAQNTALRDTVAQFSKVTSMSGHRSISAKMASSSGLALDVKKFAAAPALQSGMDYRKHLKNINSVTTQLEEYTQKTITSVAAIEKKTKAEVKNIAKMKTTESQLAAVVALEKNLSATISETSNTLSNTSIVTANFSKNLDGLVKVTKDDSEAIRKLKKNTVESYNAFEASNRVLQEHKTILSTLKEKTALYRKELQEKQKLEKEIANLTDEQRKIALLDQQNQRLAVAKAEFVAMSTAAEKYKNTLQAATRVGAKGYVPMPTNVPYTPTGGELTDKLNTMGSNYSELKRVTDARKESTDTIIAEAQALSQAASVADTYEDRLNLTKAATDKFKEALKENKDAMQTLNVLSANTGSNFKTYSKYVNENDAATLSLKNKVTDLANSYYDAQVGLKTQNTESAKNISMLGAEEARLKQVIKANNEANKARMKAQASQTAMTQLQGVPAGIASVSSNLVARQGVNTSAMASAKEFLAAADATNVYEDKLENLDSAYNVVNGAMKENKLAMASAKLTMEPLLAAYAEFKGDLDETDPKAKALKDTIEAMKKAYGDNMRAMREQGIEFESTRDSIVAEKKEWESLEKTARQASDKMQKKLEENARKVKANQDRVKGAMTDVASLARTVGMSITRYITAPIVAAGLQAVRFTAQMEMNIKSISILLGKNEEAAEELYTQVTRYAASTPYEIPDLTTATKQLLAYGSASKDVMKELQMLGDLAQNDAQKLESVTSAFGKVQARGVAHMRELNRFIMAGVPIIETLEKVINKVPEDLFKAVEQGQVSFDAVKQAVEMLTSEGGRFHNMSEELASTVKGRWATLSDEINLALKAFADDYMPIILKAIESVIDFARALQTMSASQRNMIKNWAFAAAAIGPILLMLSKMIITIRAIYSFINKSIATQKILNMLTVKYNMTLQAASITLTKGIVGTVLLLITLIGGALLSKVKRVTQEFQKQKDAAVAIMEEISAKTRGEGYEDYVRAKAKEYITTNSSEIPEDFVFKTLLNETKESAPIVLANMETFMREYNQKMRELVAARTIWEIALTTPRMRSSMGAGDPSSKIEEINNEIKALETTLEPKLKEASAAPTYMDTLKRRLGIGEASVQDITSLLNVFKYNTEAAINGTVEQFALFSSVIPVSGQAVEAMNNIIAAYEEGGEAMRSLSEDQFKRVVGAAGVQEGTTTYNLLKYLEAPTEEDVRTALDGYREFINTVIKFKEDAVEDYIKATEVTFRKENLADIFFAGENWGKVDPALISKRADSIASAYNNIISAALDEIMRDEFTLSIDQAFKKLKDDNEELFAKWEQSLKTARVTKKYDEFTKIQSDYGNKLSQIGKTEIQQFEQQLQDLKKELDGSDYEITSDAVNKLVASFSQLKFKEVEADLIAQKNALLLTSDALEELTYRQNNFKDAQIKGLRELKSYTNTIKELQEISGKDTGNIPLLADLSKVSEAMNKYSSNPWGKVLKGSTKYLTETTKYRGMTKADYFALGDEISKAFESISKEIFEADEATKRLIYSSNEYAVFMSALTADKNFSELFSDVSITTMVEAAKSQLTSLTVEIENFGKSTEEIMLATWEKILGDTEALKLFDDSELELINELIKKYKELIELQEDVNDNWNDMIKEIGSVSDVFRRNSRQDMHDRIQKAGEESNIEQSVIDDTKAMYDKVEDAKILKGVLDSIANTGFDALISQLEEVGYAMAEGATWGEAFAGTMQSVVGAIIDALPQLLLNAGLQLVVAGNPWGWALIAASGVAALVKGHANGEINGNKDGTTTPSNLNFSAKGDSFDRGRILNVPTVFNTASGLNIGGELGTEAILPLSRDSSGRLGVNVSGSGNGNTIVVPVTVNIVNQSGVETEAEVSETTNADGGKNIEVVIKRIVNNGMANGEYDRTMKSRYGLSNRGVS